MFGFSTQSSTLLTNEATVDSRDTQIKVVSAKGTMILYQFHYIKNCTQVLRGWGLVSVLSDPESRFELLKIKGLGSSTVMQGKIERTM